MRIVVTGAVLLAVVSTAVVAVCQHSESRRLQHRIWQLEKRRLRLERQAQRLESVVNAARTPRRLLVESDLKLVGVSALAAEEAGATPAAPVRPRDVAPEHVALAPATVSPEKTAVPPGFVTGGNFEGGDR